MDRYAQVTAFAVSAFLIVAWGAYLVDAIIDYRRRIIGNGRRRADLVVALRRLVVSLCLWLLCVWIALHAEATLAGEADEPIFRFFFFMIGGINIVGAIFTLVSLHYDD